MNADIDLLATAAKRMREERDRQILANAGKPSQSAESILAEFMDRTSLLAGKVAELDQRNREWLATLPQADECPVHGTERTISFEESKRTRCDFARRARHTGPSNGEFFAEYVCPICQRVATFGQWQQLRIPEKFWGASLDDLTYDTEKCRRFHEVCRKFESDPRGFLLLLGNPGNGKTHIACAILGNRGRGLFISQSDLIDAHRRTYRDEAAENVRQKAINTPLLVLDEIGVATGGNDAAALLFDILNARYSNKRPTILTSNMPREELLRTLGQRIVDRIDEAAFAVLRFDEPSKRKQANAEYLEGFS
jgi:DNA replication protein DnaC